MTAEPHPDSVPRNGKLSWDVELRDSVPALARLMRALVMVGGHFTDTFRTGRHAYAWLTVRVWIPVDREAEFLDEAQIEQLAPPPRMAPLDMHDERPVPPPRVAIRRGA